MPFQFPGNVGPPSGALNADPNAPAGLQPAGDLSPCLPRGIAGNPVLNHNRVAMRPVTRARFGNGVDTPASIELLLRHSRGGDRR